MKLVIFGLTISSSWGNGHATLWRGLCRALARRGHDVIFYERDVPYYARNRDLTEMPWGGELRLYAKWRDVYAEARRELQDADVGIVTSFCPDGISATALTVDSPVPIAAFYDLDTPVTLDRLAAGEELSYVGSNGLRDFDLVLSYSGGEALDRLRRELGARYVRTLYNSVDPKIHRPSEPYPPFAGDLSYLGTYAEDRQPALEQLLTEPAQRLPAMKFVIGGAQYPETFPWRENIYFVRHVDPPLHPSFYSSSRLTLNITRRAMREMGYCPQGRIFEAAACGTPVLTDRWNGIDEFFEPGREILVASTTEDAVDALRRSPDELAAIGRRARERTLEEHTAECRAQQLERILDDAYSRAAPVRPPAFAQSSIAEAH